MGAPVPRATGWEPRRRVAAPPDRPRCALHGRHRRRPAPPAPPPTTQPIIASDVRGNVRRRGPYRIGRIPVNAALHPFSGHEPSRGRGCGFPQVRGNRATRRCPPPRGVGGLSDSRTPGSQQWPAGLPGDTRVARAGRHPEAPKSATPMPPADTSGDGRRMRRRTRDAIESPACCLLRGRDVGCPVPASRHPHSTQPEGHPLSTHPHEVGRTVGHARRASPTHKPNSPVVRCAHGRRQ